MVIYYRCQPRRPAGEALSPGGFSVADAASPGQEEFFAAA